MVVSTKLVMPRRSTTSAIYQRFVPPIRVKTMPGTENVVVFSNDNNLKPPPVYLLAYTLLYSSQITFATPYYIASFSGVETNLHSFKPSLISLRPLRLPVAKGLVSIVSCLRKLASQLCTCNIPSWTNFSIVYIESMKFILQIYNTDVIFEFESIRDMKT